MVTDFLETKRSEIAARMRELKPLVEEYEQLDAAATALAGLGGNSAAAPARRGRPANGRRRTSRATARTAAGSAKATRRTRSTGRRGRPRGSGTRTIQALELVKGQPGITIPELADRMGIKQNYLYRVLPALQSDGKVRKQGRGWHPKG